MRCISEALRKARPGLRRARTALRKARQALQSTGEALQSTRQALQIDNHGAANGIQIAAIDGGSRAEGRGRRGDLPRPGHDEPDAVAGEEAEVPLARESLQLVPADQRPGLGGERGDQVEHGERTEDAKKRRRLPGPHTGPQTGPFGGGILLSPGRPLQRYRQETPAGN